MKQALNDAKAALVLGGDVMLGRLVGRQIGLHGPGYPLGEIAGLMRRADLAIVNLECAMTSSAHHWKGAPKAFYFGAPPEAVQSLLGAGVGGVSLANNHVLDFDVAGLHDTLHTLRQHGIGSAGAGNNADEARTPVFFERNGIRFGMVAFCDHQPDFAAGQDKPGIACLDLADEAQTMEQFRHGLQQIRNGAADWPILSLHWGANWARRPSQHFVNLAHAAIDMGYRILFGHSAHVFQGVEIYRGCPIVYAAGDLVDDYRVDPDLRNDHQLVFELELTRSALQRIMLHPVFIEDCRVRPAGKEQYEFIASRAIELCSEMGTRLECADGRLRIDCGQE
jgi:poly-gamma-glutamate capsule biosynthesis protein CapA/YwtB (metallophosphatase superfamily)